MAQRCSTCCLSYSPLGQVAPDRPLCICEGWATGATLHQDGSYTVAAAMNAGNLKPVALALRARYPGLELILAGDEDRHTEGNPGLPMWRQSLPVVKWLSPTGPPTRPPRSPTSTTSPTGNAPMNNPDANVINLRPAVATIKPDRPCWAVYEHWVTNEKGEKLRPGVYRHGFKRSDPRSRYRRGQQHCPSHR